MPRGIKTATAFEMQPEYRLQNPIQKFNAYNKYLDSLVKDGKLDPSDAMTAKMNNRSGAALVPPTRVRKITTADQYKAWLTNLALPDTREMRKQFQTLMNPRISKGWVINLGASVDEGAGRPTQRNKQMSQMGGIEDEERLGFGF